MGDVVNVASRLQTMAPPGSVYIGDSTAALASDEIVRDLVDDIDVPGREQTERVWHVTGLHRRLPTIGTRTDVPFVGRANQRELLASVMTMVANGRSAVVAVTGEAGSGKTRLVSEMLQRFPSRSAVVFAGACAPYGENNVWAPIASALFRRMGIDPSAPAGSDPPGQPAQGHRVLPLRGRRPGARPVRRDRAPPAGSSVRRSIRWPRRGLARRCSPWWSKVCAGVRSTARSSCGSTTCNGPIGS